MSIVKGMELRLDPVTAEPIVLATDRAKRPHFGVSKIGKALMRHLPQAGEGKPVDPFGVGNEAVTGPETYSDSDDPHHEPNDQRWKVRVVPNLYPITAAHEVIIHSPDPKKDIDQMSLRQTERLVCAYIARWRALQGYGQVYLFCNHGAEAGATVTHPHSQIMAWPALPPVIERRAAAMAAIYAKQGTCVYCGLIETELTIGRRVVWQNDEYILLCPEASGWPYQLQLLPKIHQAQPTSIKSDIQVKQLAEALQVMVRLYATVLGRPAYNFWFHAVHGRFFHWYIEMVPRTKVLAGVEIGAGMMVNDTIGPEAAAAEFRQALKGY